MKCPECGKMAAYIPGEDPEIEIDLSPIDSDTEINFEWPESRSITILIENSGSVNDGELYAFATQELAKEFRAIKLGNFSAITIKLHETLYEVKKQIALAKLTAEERKLLGFE